MATRQEYPSSSAPEKVAITAKKSKSPSSMVIKAVLITGAVGLLLAIALLAIKEEENDLKIGSKIRSDNSLSDPDDPPW